MAIRKTEAVVLKGWKLGETSKILLLYTKMHGRVKVVAKGARNPKSQFRGCLEPLTRIHIVYYDKPVRDLQLLSKTDLINPHYRIIGNMQKTALALAAVELLDKAVAGEEPFPRVYDLLCTTLDIIHSTDQFAEGVFWFFENHFIGLLGYEPNWNACLRCRRSLRSSGGRYLPAEGGLICPSCSGHIHGPRVSGEALEVLFWLQHCSPYEACSLSPDTALKHEIRSALDLYVGTHLEYVKNLKALKIYYEFERRAAAAVKG